MAAGIPADVSSSGVRGAEPSVAPSTDVARVEAPPPAASAPASLKVATPPASLGAALAESLSRATSPRPTFGTFSGSSSDTGSDAGTATPATPANAAPLLRSRDDEGPMLAELAARSGAGEPPAPDAAPSSSTSSDTSVDRVWLERHARALYPFLREQLRGEFLRDRERRGRLVREQR